MAQITLEVHNNAPYGHLLLPQLKFHHLLREAIDTYPKLLKTLSVTWNCNPVRLEGAFPGIPESLRKPRDFLLLSH
jgi:hypothetical protein